ncbi:hypothetical protein BpHYR1_021089 [Brachionus plicatilis]|uniref:Uncharacterized protein n=1 Tax=Brachionus plicatilis TaxID=10195 RepID=A0A3M7SKU0_BRAPC|nr:hypothetical protein BpHYR1_021089 [Brachionus plicatilis]
MVNKKLYGIAQFPSKILKSAKKKLSKKEKKIEQVPRNSIDNNHVTNIDEELEKDEETHAHAVPNFIRRFSAIDSVVKEARVYSKRHTIDKNPEFSNNELKETNHINNRRLSKINIE